MRISKEQLQKIIAEEVQAHFKKSLMSESKSESRTIEATPAMLKRIINEEVSKLNEMDDVTDKDVLLEITSDGSFLVSHKGEKEPLALDGQMFGELLSSKYNNINMNNIYYKYSDGSPNPPQSITSFPKVEVKIK